jgi:O-antigen/teichoic acid export membrane protein
MSEIGSVTRGAKPYTEPSLRLNVAWALAGNVGYSVCQWGVLASIAKLGTPADVGRFALGLALTAPVITLANLYLRVIEATDARGEYPFSIYLALRLLTTVLALGVIAVIAIALGYREGTFRLILAVALAKAFEAVSEVVFGLLQQGENLRRCALSMLAKGIFSVVAVAGVLRLTGNLVTATFAMALAWALMLVAYDLPAAARIGSIWPVFDTRSLASLAWLALPMGCVTGLASLTSSVPRYAVEASLGPVGLGHFAAVAYIFVAASQPMMALGVAVTPRLARHFVTDARAFRRLVRRTVAVALGLGLLGVAGAALCGRTVLTIAYAAAYAEDAPVLLWLAAAACVAFVANVLGAAATAARRLPQQLPIAVLCIAVCAGASHLLVPRYGLIGAGWAVLATETMRLLCLTQVYAGALSAKRRASLAVAPATAGEAAAAN